MLLAVIAALIFAQTGRAATRNNDDSCDIAVVPAATLLLPIFDVSVYPESGSDTTLFTITNTSSVEQVAHVTVWSDWAYPVLAFNLVLTGYDVQAINLYDVLARGVIGSRDPVPGNGAAAGSTPAPGGSNPNITDHCPAAPDLPASLLTTVQTALTTGIDIPGCNTPTRRVGGTHSNARGYLTIDVVNACTSEFPTSVIYYDRDLLFDNVLIGDYQQVSGEFAQGSPMVHIRAIPEGGPAGSHAVTNLPYTFYDRYTTLAAQRRFDRRQPLPSTFAARWIEGDPSFRTSYRIWREGITVGPPSCTTMQSNSSMPIAEVIRFDEHENSVAWRRSDTCSAGCGPPFNALPAASISSTSNLAVYPPPFFSPDVAGWMYFNLDNSPAGGPPPAYTSPPPGTSRRASQNWVIVSMSAAGRFAVDFDAAMLGNGCSPRELAPSREIGPAR